MAEFNLIRRYFQQLNPRNDVLLGVGDDAALLRPPAGRELALSTDTLIQGVHFPENTPAEAIAYKSLAVSLSDMAAMGAEPAWMSLNLSLPALDDAWLEGFTQGLAKLAEQHNVSLVGGDTTQTTGPIVVSMTVVGFLNAKTALQRTTCNPGDVICVSGTLGDAALALQQLFANEPIDPQAMQALNYPQAQVDLGRFLVGRACSAIDVSDGLLADLAHLLATKQMGADIQISQLPLSAAVKDYCEHRQNWDLALAGGDDYQLLFTLPEAQVEAMLKQARELGFQVSAIGQVRSDADIRVFREDGLEYQPMKQGYEHFTPNKATNEE